jgi:hypothetical protein
MKVIAINEAPSLAGLPKHRRPYGFAHGPGFLRLEASKSSPAPPRLRDIEVVFARTLSTALVTKSEQKTRANDFRN